MYTHTNTHTFAYLHMRMYITCRYAQKNTNMTNKHTRRPPPPPPRVFSPMDCALTRNTPHTRHAPRRFLFRAVKRVVVCVSSERGWVTKANSTLSKLSTCRCGVTKQWISVGFPSCVWRVVMICVYLNMCVCVCQNIKRANMRVFTRTLKSRCARKPNLFVRI